MQDERGWQDKARMFATLAAALSAPEIPSRGSLGVRSRPKKSKNRKACLDKKKKRKAAEKARRKNR